MITPAAMEKTLIQSQKKTQASKEASAQKEASPLKILQNIVQKKVSGRLTVRDPNDESIFWRVHFGNGKVHFATSAMGQRERLEYLLQRYCPGLDCKSAGRFKSDYDLICHYWKAEKLSLQQARKLMFVLSQEAFVQLLALPKAVVQFEKTVGLDPILLSVPLKEVILPMRGTINQWQQLRPEINSPFQRLELKNLEELPNLLWQKVRDIKYIQALGKILAKNMSLYELARHLKTDTLSLAALLQPLVRAGAVEVNPYRCPQSNSGPIIACIDDSSTVQRNVKMILEAAGFRVLGISEPAKALSALARYKPALVLMDINMPEINGYELSRLLRQSDQLQQVPIVMLTGRDGMIDKLRARMVGANDYMTKPFEPQQLLATVRDHLEEPKNRLEPVANSGNISGVQFAYS